MRTGGYAHAWCEQREQHGDAGGVDEEDELLLEQGVELRLGHVASEHMHVHMYIYEVYIHEVYIYFNM
tara:strand:+ start:108 stop:311 length:204 start_codon:yes stop_codon:yes gene_type:complete